MNKRFKEVIEHGNDAIGTGNVLSKLNVQDLREIKVSIRRHNVPDPPVSIPLQRNLEDPADLILHRRGEGQHPLFARDDIVVNIDEHLEERIVLKSPIRSTERRSRSKTKETENYRSRSPRKRRSSTPSPPRRKHPEKRDRPDVRPSSSYKRTESDLARRTSPKDNKYYKERSPKPSTTKGNREIDRSPRKEREKSPRKERERSPKKDNRYSRSSPRRTDYRENSPKRRSRSRSPKKTSNYKQTGTISNKRRSSSPHSSRRHSRSPYTSRKRSRSPHSKRYSRSPHTKRTPPREERGYTGNKTRKRSPSPYSRRHSPSPYKSENYHKNKRRSRTPTRRDGYSESRYRRHSRSPDKIHKHSQNKEAIEYGEVPTDFEYYGAEGFWIPGPIPRPRFLPRAMIPPPIIMPRGIMRPVPPYIVPRPYLPMPYQFRPRFPVTQNRPYRQRMIVAPSTSTATTTAPDAASSTVATSNVLVVETLSPIIEEAGSNVAENVDSTEPNKA